MAAAVYDFEIEQGASLSVVFTWYDSSNSLVDLTSYTAAMKAKVNVDDTTAVIDSSSNLTITLGGALGTITLIMTASQTAALTFRTTHYDLELTLNGTVTRLVKGIITLSKEVTTS
jgi:hypothetical protein